MSHHAYAKGSPSQSTTAPSRPGLPSRPFPVQETGTEAPDLAVQQERAERFGHRLGHNFSMSASPIQRVEITRDMLKQGKRDLRKAGRDIGDDTSDRFRLGPVDKGQTDVERHEGIKGYQYADMVASMRRGITSLRADLNDQGGVGGDDETYARTSMDEWARRTYNIVGTGEPYKRNYTEDVARALYDNWRADSPANEQNRQPHEDALFGSLRELHGQSAQSGVVISNQETGAPPQEDFANEVEKEKAYGSFAYRMLPNPLRPLGNGGKGGMARFSLNMDVEQSADYATRMRDQVSSDEQNINQAKIMGPSHIGKRVDDGVVYLNQPNVENAFGVADELGGGMKQPSVRSVPPGMEPIRPGVSYAEYMPGSSSSHGQNRGEIIANAVHERMDEEVNSNEKTPISDLVGKHIVAKRYDPKQPSRIDLKPILERRVRDARQATGYGNLLAEKMNSMRRAMGYEDDE